MKIRIGIVLIVMLALVSIAASLSPPPEETEETGDPGWTPIVEGAVDYQLFVLGDPNKVYVTRLHRDNPNAFIESSIAQGRLSGAFETVRSMFFRYDQAINYWDPDLTEPSAWGGRNHVVAAINGFFFDFGTGIGESGQVHSSWFAKRYEVNGFAEGFVWKSNGQPFMGECIYQNPALQKFIHTPTQTTITITGLNRDRDGNELILYTPQFGPSTLTPDKDNSVEVLIQVDGPARLRLNNLGVTGVIREIREGQGSSLIPFDYVVVSAHGAKKEALMAIPIAVGDAVEINQKVQNEETSNCDVTQTVGWGLAYAGIGGYPTILKNGEIFTPDPNGDFRNPRTAIAFNDDYVYFVVVDGRNPGISVGMTHLELATFIRDTLGAGWAINQDGGGSSTMVIHGSVVNNTTGNDSRCLPPESIEAAPTAGPEQETEPVAQGGTTLFLPAVRHCTPYERPVVNGMMMVVYEPMNSSQSFDPEQEVITPAESTVRLGPGTNYASIAVVGPGTLGVIQDDVHDLEGVQAKGYYWWKVAFGGLVGWVPEGDLAPVAAPQDAPADLPAQVNPPSLPE